MSFIRAEILSTSHSRPGWKETGTTGVPSSATSANPKHFISSIRSTFETGDKIRNNGHSDDSKKSRVGGGRTKVSQIANIFQKQTSKEEPVVVSTVVAPISKPVSPKLNRKCYDDQDMRDSAPPTQVTVVRTESHLARFNTARAMFEKLGTGNGVKTAKSGSTGSGVSTRSGSVSPVRSPKLPSDFSRSPSPGTIITNQDTNDLFTSLPASLNTIGTTKINGIDPNTAESKMKTQQIVKPVRQNLPTKSPQSTNIDSAESSPQKVDKPQKPERRISNRELIEKQKNWISHFAKPKTSPTRNHSDPKVETVIVRTNYSSDGRPNSLYSEVRKPVRITPTKVVTPAKVVTKSDDGPRIKDVLAKPLPAIPITMKTVVSKDSSTKQDLIEHERRPASACESVASVGSPKPDKVREEPPEAPSMKLPPPPPIATIEDDDETLKNSENLESECKSDGGPFGESLSESTTKNAPLAQEEASITSSSSVEDMGSESVNGGSNEVVKCDRKSSLDRENRNSAADIIVNISESVLTPPVTSSTSDRRSWTSTGSEDTIHYDPTVTSAQLDHLQLCTTPTTLESPVNGESAESAFFHIVDELKPDVIPPDYDFEPPIDETTPTQEPDVMSPEEADNFLSSSNPEAILSDEEAKEVFQILSPTKKEFTTPIFPDNKQNNESESGISSDAPDSPFNVALIDSADIPNSTFEVTDSCAESDMTQSQDMMSSKLDTSYCESVSSITDALSSTFTVESGKEVYYENGIHYLEDGHFWIEVPGLPDSEEEFDEDPAYSMPVRKSTRIRFSSQPIKVYSTYSVSDYDRRNEDVDPVAASAEYELEKRVEKMNVFPVELIKGPEGLGLSIIGMGVGADAGLEKLGIFVKTITNGGAAARDGRIQVNDQIIEVDAKSLVGVTQAYAASVLRNTCGLVRFLIGREKDPQNSEVAQLIRQSLQADRDREERRRELMLQHHHQHSRPSGNNGDHLSNDSRSEDSSLTLPIAGGCGNSNDLASSSSPPLSTPEDAGSPTGEAFDLEASTYSPTGSNGEMDQHILKMKLREAQHKMVLAEADIAQLRARLVDLEGRGGDKEGGMEMCRAHLKDCEKALLNTKKEVQAYQLMLEESQGQYITIEKKYHKAKRLIREFQQREQDFIHREEYHLQQLQEKDTEYNALVKALKDRVIQLEQDLTETQRKMGLPVQLPYDSNSLKQFTPQLTRRQQIPPPTKPLLLQHLETDFSDTEISDTSPEDTEKQATVERKVPVKEELDKAVPPHELLDLTASKTKAELANKGGLAGRQLPSVKKMGSSSSSGSLDQSLEEDLSPLEAPSATVHQSSQQSSVIPQPSDVLPLVPTRTTSTHILPPVTTSHPVINNPPVSLPTRTTSQAPPPYLSSFADPQRYMAMRNDGQHHHPHEVSRPSQQPQQIQHYPGHVPTHMQQSLNEQLKSALAERHLAQNLNREEMKDNSSPSKPMHFPPGQHTSDGDKRSHDAAKKVPQHYPLSTRVPVHPPQSLALPTQPIWQQQGSSPLREPPHSPTVSNTSLSASPRSTTSSSSLGGSGDLLALGLVNKGSPTRRSTDYCSSPGSWSADMKGSQEILGDDRKGHLWQSRPITEWPKEQVCQWLLNLGFEQYIPQFMDRNVGGSELLLIESKELKSLGVSSEDKVRLKKKIKELRFQVEKEKKHQEKDRKEKQKIQKKAEKLAEKASRRK